MANKKKSFIISCLFLLLALFVIVKEAEMTQVSYRQISLKDLIEDSNCIVIAKKASPPMSQEAINITPFFQRIFGKKHPPFMKITYHFNLVETLYVERDIPKDAKIDVSPAEQENNFEIHKDYYLKGVGESPIYSSYKSSINIDDCDQAILFLSTTDYKRFRYCVTGAFESTKLKEKILRIIKKCK